VNPTVPDVSRDRKSEYYFEEIGEDFQRFMSSYDVSRRISLIGSLLPAERGQMTCLEVGCGTGIVSRFLGEMVGELTVVDISGVLARQVGESLNCRWGQQDACALSVPDGSYDLVVSSEVIEHTPDPQRALREMCRVLRPGGCLVVTTPNKLWYPVLWISEKLRLRHFAGNEIWLFPRCAVGLLRGEGMVVRGVSGCHLFPWHIPGSQSVLPLFDRLGRVLYPAMINFGVSAVKG
jgi:2-polyprenyl-6-hydroxyphenyl methylase/3-demethylubiquinone-9 3-methyltransferase